MFYGVWTIKILVGSFGWLANNDTRKMLICQRAFLKHIKHSRRFYKQSTMMATSGAGTVELICPYLYSHLLIREITLRI